MMNFYIISSTRHLSPIKKQAGWPAHYAQHDFVNNIRVPASRQRLVCIYVAVQTKICMASIGTKASSQKDYYSGLLPLRKHLAKKFALTITCCSVCQAPSHPSYHPFSWLLTYLQLRYHQSLPWAYHLYNRLQDISKYLRTSN